MTLGLLLLLTTMMPQPIADQTCLATTVYLEARGESTIGQFAVAEVAMHRRDHGRYNHSVCKVVEAPWQFAISTTPKSFKIDNLKAWNKAWSIAGETIDMWKLPKNQRVVVVPNADHFVKLSEAQPAWAHGAPLRTIGEHSFYAVN